MAELPLRQGVTRTTAVVSCLLIGALFSVLFWSGILQISQGADSVNQVHPPEQQPVPVYSPFNFDVERLQNEWLAERQQLGSSPPGTNETTVIEAYFDSNRQLAHQDASPRQQSALGQIVSNHINDYISENGTDAFRRLGWYLADEFMGSVLHILQESQSEDVDLQVLLNSGTDTSIHRERTGDFFLHMEELGLVTLENRLSVPPDLLKVIFRYRWFQFSHHTPSLSYMTPYEREILTRWRIESTMSTPLVERLALLDESRSIYEAMGVDANAVRAAILLREGEVHNALEAIQGCLALSPGDSRYIELSNEIEQNLSSAEQ